MAQGKKAVEQETRDVKNRGKFRNGKSNKLKRLAERNGEKAPTDGTA